MKKIVKNDEYYMSLALKEAQKAALLDEVPVGAIIVKDGAILAKTHNLKETKQQSTAHAEILAIQKAEKKLNNWNLSECDLYVTLEPCMMCMGAIYLSRVNRLIYGTKDPKGGAVESLIQSRDIPFIKSWPRTVKYGVLQPECAEILSSFFKNKRKQKKEEKKQLMQQ